MVRYFELDPMLAGRYDRVWRWIDWPDRQGCRHRDRPGRPGPGHRGAHRDPVQVLRADPHPGQGRHRLLLHRLGQAAVHQPDHHLHHRQVGQERRGRPGRSDDPGAADRAGRRSPSPRSTGTIAWPGDELTSPSPTPTQRAASAPAGRHRRGASPASTAARPRQADHGVRHRQDVHRAEVRRTVGGRARRRGPGPVLRAVDLSCCRRRCGSGPRRRGSDLRAFAVCSDTEGLPSADREDITPTTCRSRPPPIPAKLAAQMKHRQPRRGPDGGVLAPTSRCRVVAARPAGRAGRLRPGRSATKPTAPPASPWPGRTSRTSSASTTATYLRGDRRLYMTATPRIFDENVKDKAEEHSAGLTSMDDETVYGPEFHRLSFGEAVERGLLTDYKVLVLTVDEELDRRAAAGTVRRRERRDHPRRRHQDRRLLERPGQTRRRRHGRQRLRPREVPMKRAVAFLRDIASSKQARRVVPARSSTPTATC